MKKTILGILTLVVVLSTCAATAFAAGHNGARNFTDNNNDWVCDNSNTICAYADKDENGVCDAQDAKNENCTAENGKAFVDEDKDGICDNYALGQGRGGEYGHRNQGKCESKSQGEKGKSFVDTDNDGICDNYVPEKCNGDGSGCGAKNGCRNGFKGGCGK